MFGRYPDSCKQPGWVLIIENACQKVLINHMHFQLSAYGNCLFASSENELDAKRSPGLLMKYLAVEDCALQVRSLQVRVSH
jgi:hypothetical protein